MDNLTKQNDYKTPFKGQGVEYPILFSTPMVQAILEGRKTHTRRILKVKGCRPFVPDSNWTIEDIERWNKNFHSYGQSGDLLWVRESHRKILSGYIYRANPDEAAAWPVGWKPSIHMPKAAARIWLQTTAIRAERVADISEEDCIAEGIRFNSIFYKYECPICDHFGHSGKSNICEDGFYSDAKSAFKELWNAINGKPSPIQKKINGKLTTVGYICFPFDEESAQPYAGKTIWRNKPLTVIINPWVHVIEFTTLSTIGKPQLKSSRGNYLVNPIAPGSEGINATAKIIQS